MRINSARPIRVLTAKEQDGLLKLLFPAEQPEVFTRNGKDDFMWEFQEWHEELQPSSSSSHLDP